MSVTLHGYQQQAVDFALPRDAAWFTMDCGTGKTIPAIRVIEELILDARARAVLVVAPLRVMFMVWPAELDKFSWLPYTLLHGPDKAARLRQKKSVYLINYEGLVWLKSQLKRGKGPAKSIDHWPFDAVVFDESSMMKSPSSQRFSKWRNLFKDRSFAYRLNLTASPRANGLMDLWAQTFILDGGERLGESITEYRSRYFFEPEPGIYREHAGSADTVHRKIADLCFRVSREETRDYPDSTLEDIEVELDETALDAYDELERECFIQLEGQDIEAMNIAVLTGKLLQFAGGFIYTDPDTRNVLKVHDCKLRALREEIITNQNEPVIVAYGYQSEADAIMEEHPDACDLRRADTFEKTRDVVARWNVGEIPMLLMHPASGGHGLNLQHGGRTVLWYGLNWSYDYWEQLNSRVWRQGQTREVRIKRFVAKNTIDEAVVAAIARKARGQGALFAVLQDLARMRRCAS